LPSNPIKETPDQHLVRQSQLTHLSHDNASICGALAIHDAAKVMTGSPASGAAAEGMHMIVREHPVPTHPAAEECRPALGRVAPSAREIMAANSLGMLDDSGALSGLPIKPEPNDNHVHWPTMGGAPCPFCGAPPELHFERGRFVGYTRPARVYYDGQYLNLSPQQAMILLLLVKSGTVSFDMLTRLSKAGSLKGIFVVTAQLRKRLPNSVKILADGHRSYTLTDLAPCDAAAAV
jgi:hypothetical protein